jgi:hypothetical protein
MGDPGSALALGLATNIVTELIRSLIQIASTAQRCQAECRELEAELRSIQPDVERIELQLHELHLQSVDEWWERLKAGLHLASIRVHKANTASRLGAWLGSYTLSKKISAQNTKIKELAASRVTLHVQLANMLKEENSRYPPAEFRKWSQEKNAIVDREEITRLSERHQMAESVTHMNGYGSAGLDQSSPHAPHHPESHPRLHRGHTTS